jgi:hypothetical protein
MRHSSGRKVTETGPNHTSKHARLNAAKNAKLELSHLKKTACGN